VLIKERASSDGASDEAWSTKIKNLDEQIILLLSQMS